MKIVRKALLVLIGSLLLHSGYAQNALHIEIINQGTLDTTAALGDTMTFTVLVRNDSASTFVGQIGFAYDIFNFQFNDTISGSAPDTASGFDFPSQNDTLGFGDSAFRTIITHVTNPAFKSGPSVVVIWPIAANAHAKDSISFYINIQTSGINEPGEKKVRLFKQGNALRVERETDVQLKRVRIFDVLGRPILDRQNPADNIPLPYMNNGIYLAEITYNNNLRKVFRFYY